MYYTAIKSSWSKLVDEDYVLNHLIDNNENILCGIDKRFKDIYNISFDSISEEDILKQEIHICKSCFKIFLKRRKSL